MKVKFNSDKALELHSMMIVVRAVFLDKFLYEL